MLPALPVPELALEPELLFAPLAADTPDAAMPDADPLLLPVVPPVAVVPDAPGQEGCGEQVSLMLWVTSRTLDSSD